MATRCVIAYINRETGKIKGSYCHWDGYIEGVGAELAKSYNTYEAVKSLVDECPVYSSIADGDVEPASCASECEHYEFENGTEFEDFVDRGADGCDFVYIFMQRECPATWFVYDTNFEIPSKQTFHLGRELERLKSAKR